MKIQINRVPIDFTLEEETTVADVVRSLGAWAQGQGVVLVSILADGKAVPQDDPTSITSVGLLEVEAVPQSDQNLARLSVITEFFQLLSQSLAAPNGPTEEWRAEYAAIRPGLFPTLDPVGSRAQGPLAVLDASWDDRFEVRRAADELAGLGLLLQSEVVNPGQRWDTLLKSLDETVGQAESLAGLFQKGQDKAGLEIILAFFTLLDDLNRVAPLVLRTDKLPAWDQWREDLQPFLKEAGDALEVMDYILITDLMEYEVVPRLKLVRTLGASESNLDPGRDVL